MENKNVNTEKTWVKVELECGRNMQAAHSNSMCGDYESSTSNSGQATCCY